jgi:phosphoribosyl-AMP cyclohydrolase
MNIDFDKGDGLVPAIIQHHLTKAVLMLGYMNSEALEQTTATSKVTFYSRSKQRLWVKGETSGNFLLVKSIAVDCDNDTLLVMAEPIGPVCHTGTDTCFGNTQARMDSSINFSILSKSGRPIHRKSHTPNNYLWPTKRYKTWPRQPFSRPLSCRNLQNIL